MKNKRINKELLFVLTAGLVCFSFMAFVVMVFPALKINGENIKIDGIQAIFGGEVTEGVETKFNLLSMIGYFLPALAVITSILAFKTKTIIFDIVTMFFVLAGGVLIILEPTIFKTVNQIASEIKVSYLIGPIFGIIFSTISMIFSISCIRLKLA